MSDSDFVYTARTEDLDLELRLEGALPAALRGTFYAIGGTGSAVGATPLNPFDAHGRVVAVRIADGKAALRARMVETPLWQAERSADAIVKRRLFVNKPSRWSNLFDLDLANPAGHNVVPWGDQLVATNDPGFFALDPVTLATRGPVPLQPAKGSTMGPMPRRDPATGRLVIFELRPGRRDTITVREVDDAFEVKAEQTYRLDRGAAFLHDIAITEHYYLVMQWAKLALPTLLWGASPVAAALRFDPATTPRLHLLPRAGGEPIAVALPGGRSHFHFWNAFESDGKVVADAIGYDGKVDFARFAPPAVRAARSSEPPATPPAATWRYTIDPASGAVQADPLTDLAAEAPEIRADRRGRAYRYGWAPAPGAPGDDVDRELFVSYHALARHDFEQRSTQIWDAGPRAYVSPAAFVARDASGDEDDGHVLALIQDVAASATSLAVFDARAIADGPIARLSGTGLLGAISHVAFA